MGVDYFNCDKCDEVYSEHYFRWCNYCDNVYCDDCLVELTEEYGMNEDDRLNKCYECDQEIIKRRQEKEVNELTEILKRHVDFPDPERLDILIGELLKHFK